MKLFKITAQDRVFMPLFITFFLDDIILSLIFYFKNLSEGYHNFYLRRFYERLPSTSRNIFEKIKNSVKRSIAISADSSSKSVKSAKTTNQTIPYFRAGDTLKVHVKIVEGNKERVQIFQGVVIKRQGGNGAGATFTVRKISFSVGVERTFLLHSPRIDKIEVVTRGDVRRAKLFYLRPLRGKAAKIRSRYSDGVNTESPSSANSLSENNDTINSGESIEKNSEHAKGGRKGKSENEAKSATSQTAEASA